MVTTQVIEQETTVSKINTTSDISSEKDQLVQQLRHHQSASTDEQLQQQQQWKPYIVVKPTTYKREFSISDAYLDLEDAPGAIPSVHKLIHKNRILILTLLLLYVILDNPDRFVYHLDLLNVIFLNPLVVLPELTVMHSFSMLMPIVTALYAKKMIPKKMYIALYTLLQCCSATYSVIFVLFNRLLPIGTSLFLTMELILITWKNHSYFIVRNYYSLHNMPEPDHIKKEADHKKSFLWFIGDFIHFLISPTLIYDQYQEVKAVPYVNPVPPQVRFLNFVKELYSSFCILVVVHYLNSVCIIPYLYQPPSIKTFASILIPAEINFQLQYYLLYHCVFSLLADISGFRDRLSFYEDYWAAITTKEILGKWSKPVHSWLFRHVHNDLRSLFGFSKWVSLFLTMVFSGFFHELIIMVTSRNVCFPWSTANLIGCGCLIWLESTVKGLATSTWYRTLMRVLLLLGHAGFYFALYHLCYSNLYN